MDTPNPYYAASDILDKHQLSFLHLTGPMETFAPAHRLYTRFGFKECAPFADYIEDPNSVFMTKEL
jgi:hypothetical protein